MFWARPENKIPLENLFNLGHHLVSCWRILVTPSQIFSMLYVQPQVLRAECSKEIQDCYKVRIKVFVHEQNIPLELEIDEYVIMS
jgi:hypothetical protein